MKLKRLCTVLIAVLALGVNHLSARELAFGEWTVRLILTSDAEGLEDSYNTLGQLSDALPGFDLNDLPELGDPWQGTYLSVIFYHPEWETERETFNTDYHPISSFPPGSGCALPPQPDTEEEWTFEVRSNDTTRDLSLTWIGSEWARMHKMVLVDVEDNVMVAAEIDGVTQQYQFRMGGTVREFAWRQLTDQQYAEFVATSGVSASPVAFDQARASSITTEDASTSEQTKKKSEWLPRGWSQGNGSSRPVPEGLPDDPFGD